jgi:hypothetical protein
LPAVGASISLGLAQWRQLAFSAAVVSASRAGLALLLLVATNYRRQGPAGDYAECQSEMAGDWELGIGGPSLCTTCTTQRRPPQLGGSSSRPGTRTRHSPLLTGLSLSLLTIAPLKIGVCNTGMALNRPPPS